MKPAGLTAAERRIWREIGGQRIAKRLADRGEVARVY